MKHAPLRGLRCLPRDRTGTSSATTPVFLPAIRHPTEVGVLPDPVCALYPRLRQREPATGCQYDTRGRSAPIVGGAWEAAPDIESRTRKTAGDTPGRSARGPATRTILRVLHRISGAASQPPRIDAASSLVAARRHCHRHRSVSPGGSDRFERTMRWRG